MSMSSKARGANRLPLVAAVAAMSCAGFGASATAASAATQACAPVQIVYAAGTSEPNDPYGAVLGNTLVADFQYDVPGASAYAVNYPASTVEPYSAQAGNLDLVNHVEAQHTACPNEKFVISGYSQGANVVAMSFGVNTAADWVGAASVTQLPASYASYVSGVLAFGPPYHQQRQSIPTPWSKVLDQFATPGDIFASVTPNIITGLTIHLTSYQADLAGAASYAASNYKAGITAASSNAKPGPGTSN